MYIKNKQCWRVQMEFLLFIAPLFAIVLNLVEILKLIQAIIRWILNLLNDKKIKMPFVVLTGNTQNNI